jgi:putative transposase
LLPSWIGIAAKYCPGDSPTQWTQIFRIRFGGSLVEARQSGYIQHRPGGLFTSFAFTNVLREMDGRGRWLDNVFIERLWRSLKYENVYLNAYETDSEARIGIGKWIDFYNRIRPHSRLDGKPQNSTMNKTFLRQTDKGKTN